MESSFNHEEPTDLLTAINLDEEEAKKAYITIKKLLIDLTACSKASQRVELVENYLLSTEFSIRAKSFAITQSVVQDSLRMTDSLDTLKRFLGM